MQNNDITCLTCNFFDGPLDKNPTIGFCKFTSPVIIPQTGNKKGHWPIVGVTERACGEYEEVSK